MIGVVAVLVARLVDPLSIGAALVVAWLAGGAGRWLRIILPVAALGISAGVSFAYCALQSACREPFDGQGVVMWLIGALASAVHLLIALAVLRWFRRRGAK